MPWQPFDLYAERYDRWFDEEPGRFIFPSEVAAIELLLGETQLPRLEVGVGTGRFAAALGTTVGVDPAPGVLRVARRRGVEVVQTVGEALPFAAGSFGSVLFIATLCFLDDPKAALREAVRVLTPGGAILVADVIADSPWGRFYIAQKASGHPFYAQATFYTLGDLHRLLEEVGLRVAASASTLIQTPGSVGIDAEEPVRSIATDASFVCLLARTSLPRSEEAAQSS